MTNLVYAQLCSLQPQSPDIPPWPLRIVWHRFYRPFGFSFEVCRAPSLEEALKLTQRRRNAGSFTRCAAITTPELNGAGSAFAMRF